MEAEAWAPTPEQLAAYTGRYFSEELETFYTFVVEDDALILQHRRMDDRSLSTAEEHGFAAAGTQIEFTVSDEGQAGELHDVKRADAGRGVHTGEVSAWASCGASTSDSDLTAWSSSALPGSRRAHRDAEVATFRTSPPSAPQRPPRAAGRPASSSFESR